MKLYRGFKRPIADGLHINQFRATPRISTHTPINIHLHSDEWFYNTFGIRARTNCVICSTDILQAKIYATNGSLALITPINTYRLIFSLQVRDFLDITIDVCNQDKNTIFTCLANKEYCIVDSVEKLPGDFSGEVMLDCEQYEVLTINKFI